MCLNTFVCRLIVKTKYEGSLFPPITLIIVGLFNSFKDDIAVI